MKVAPKREKLHFSDLLYICLYANMPHICMLHLTEISSEMVKIQQHCYTFNQSPPRKNHCYLFHNFAN